MFGKQFYPTPIELVDQMRCMIDWTRVSAVLEPSAGSGAIAENICPKFSSKYSGCKEPARLMDCVEIDPELCSMLRGKGLSVQQADFLEWSSYTRYDLIAMNPPFENGARHLLHAIDLMQNGGQIICLLNAETIKNPCDIYRQDLAQRLQQYGAKIKYIQNGFSHSARKTDVETAMVYIDIPKKQYDFSFIDSIAATEDFPEYEKAKERYSIATDDVISNILMQYNNEMRTGLALLDAFERLGNSFGENNNIISVGVNTKELVDKYSDASHYSKHNLFVRELRYRYWSILFQSGEMQKLLTEKTREYFRANIEKMRNYDFTLLNIKTIQLQLSQNMAKSIEDAIIEKFDKLTYQHSMSKESNVHYYSGWCTNDCFKINKKVIVPAYGLYDSFGYWSLWRARDILDELEKIFVYLNGGNQNEETVWNVMDDMNRRKSEYDGRRIHTQFFDFECKKKGTVHIWFNDLELLKKWNIFAGQKKGWLPDSYGRKGYKDLNKAEKAVVDSFEGVKEYANTAANPDFYTKLETPIMLGMGG